MEPLVPLTRTILLVGIALIAISLPVYGQIGSCSPTMIASFAPCLNFITNSTANGTSPTADCCNSLKSITSNSRDCGCQIVNGGVPFQVPINRTLAISLPRSCNMSQIPLQCKASGVPIASPGPVSLAPTLSPGVPPPSPGVPPPSPGVPPPSANPIVPVPTPSAQSPESDATPLLTPPPSTTESTAPATSSTGIRPVQSPPSPTSSSSSISPSLLILAFGVVLFKYY